MNMVANRPQSEKGSNRSGSESAPQIEKDKCWGWLVVAGCLLVHLFVGGLDRSYGMSHTFCVIMVYLSDSKNSLFNSTSDFLNNFHFI